MLALTSAVVAHAAEAASSVPCHDFSIAAERLETAELRWRAAYHFHALSFHNPGAAKRKAAGEMNNRTALMTASSTSPAGNGRSASFLL